MFFVGGIAVQFLRKNHAQVKMGQKILFHQVHQVNFKENSGQIVRCKKQLEGGGQFLFER